MADGLRGIPVFRGGGLGGIPTLGGFGPARRPLVGSRSRDQQETLESLSEIRGPGSEFAREAEGRIIRGEVKTRTSRPRPFLSVVGRVLNAPSNALLGFLEASNNYKGLGEDEAGNRLNLLVTEPWQFFKAMGAGFREVPDAVVEDKGIDIIQKNLLKKYDSDSFIGRHSGIISTTLAIVTDPTIYLSFGATAPSRIAARRTLDLATDSSLKEAQQIMARGGTLDGKRFATVQQALAYTHAKNGRPFTMGDALDQMKTISQTQRTKFAMGKVKVGNRPARFGRGMRFMGMTVPKTPEMGEFMAHAVRGKAEILHRTQPYQMLLAGMPNHVLHHVGSDILRANMLSKFTDFRRAHEVVRDRAPEDAISHIVEPLHRSINEPVLGPGSRKGIHRTAPEKVKTPELNVMRKRIEQVRVRATNAATRAGLSGRDMDNMWDEIAARYDDPLDAAAHFAVKAASRTSFQQFKRFILEDPRFAQEVTGRPQVTGVPVGLEGAIGRTPVSLGKRKFLVPDEVSEALESMKNTALQDVELSRFLRALNWPQNKWKTFATVMNPAFFTMNFVGAVFNNMLAAVYNPMDYVRAVGMVMRDRLGATPETMLEAQARGVGGLQSFIAVEAAPKTGLLEQVAQEQQSLGRAVKERQVGGLAERGRGLVRPGIGVSKTRFAGRRGRQAAGVALAATGNPLAAAAFAPEIANIGRSVNAAIEDVVRLAPFQKAAHDKELRQILEAYGPITVPGMTHPGFSKAQQKTMYDIGADISNHFQFDYRELTEMERRFAKTMFPFYTFFKKNMKLQMEQLVQQPRNLAVWEAFTTYMNEEAEHSLPEDFRRVLPEYFDNLEAFNIPMPEWARQKMGLPEGQPLYLNPKLPFITLNMFPPLWDIFRETGEPMPQKLLKASGVSTAAGMVGPLAGWGVKTMFEYVTNKQLGLARPIDYQRANSNDWRNSYRDAPGWVQFLPDGLQKLFTVKTENGRVLMTNSRIYVLEQLASPFINNLGQSIAPAGATEYQVGQAKADLVSWTTGVRLMPVDMLKLHRSWSYRLIDMLEARKQELEDQGRVLDPDDAASLKILRSEVRQLESAWDTREAELYGTP